VAAEDAKDAGADHLPEAVLAQVEIVGSSRPPAKARVSPKRRSSADGRQPGDSSTTTGLPKKGRHRGRTGGILVGWLRQSEKT
jgi:hypothetical protein